ncbi:hypothetical protein AB1Y20_014633 [Prymnesium parvum]|uniref:Uncharacterized protein n=1 Tax=Prymnesium parvum TaxID=97485 RepID=A0AB34IDW0_PRYPA
MPIDPKRLIWAADWYINDVELPLALPAPVSTPHPLCAKAAQKLRKYAGVRTADDKLLLHWALADAGLVVQGGDYLRLIVKASYRITEAEAAAGALDAAAAADAGGGGVFGGVFRPRASSSSAPPPAKEAAARLVAKPSPSEAPPKPAAGEPASRRRPKEKKRGAYAWAAQRAVRFYTSERRIYVQTLSSGMSAPIKAAEPGVRAFIDCHLAGDYVVELEEQGGDESPREAGKTEKATYVVTSLTLRFELPEMERELKKLTAEGLAAAHVVEDEPSDGGGRGVGEQLMPEMVRNLDTGEVLHMTEIEERVALGTQPQSLRPLARPVAPRGWLAHALGLAPVAVPLEPCLKPLPLLSVAGDLLTGRPLRCVVTRDRFRVGDGLARSLASSVREVRWMRHRGWTDEGLLLQKGPADEPYTPSADDVGCVISVTWHAASGAVRAETAQIQPRAGLRDAVAGLLSAGKASFEVTILDREKAPPPPPARVAAPPRASALRARGASSAPAAAPAEPLARVSAGQHKEKRKATVRIDAASRTVEVSWMSALAIRMSKAKKFSRHLRVVHHADESTFELFISVRRCYLMKAASQWERDLLALAVRRFVEEFPTPDMPADPMLLEPVVIELCEADDLQDPPPTTTPSSSSQPSAAHSTTPRLLSLSPFSLSPHQYTNLISHLAPPQDASTAPASPVTGEILVGDILRATTPKALHATGVELGWYRTTRNGVRSRIDHACGPLYSPSADDLGCMLSVEAVPYETSTRKKLPLDSLDETKQANLDYASMRDGSSSDSDYSDTGSVAPSIAPSKPLNTHAAAKAQTTFWGKPASARPPYEVRLDRNLEARLQRLCAKGYAEFRVAVRTSSHKPHTLTMTRSRLQLKQGWTTLLSWEYCEHITICIEHWAKTGVLISLDQLAVADANNAIRCSVENMEERDLLVLTLRFMVAKHAMLSHQ